MPRAISVSSVYRHRPCGRWRFSTWRRPRARSRNKAKKFSPNASPTERPSSESNARLRRSSTEAVGVITAPNVLPTFGIPYFPAAARVQCSNSSRHSSCCNATAAAWRGSPSRPSSCSTTSTNWSALQPLTISRRNILSAGIVFTTAPTFALITARTGWVRQRAYQYFALEKSPSRRCMIACQKERVSVASRGERSGADFVVVGSASADGAKPPFAEEGGGTCRKERTGGAKVFGGLLGDRVALVQAVVPEP